MVHKGDTVVFIDCPEVRAKLEQVTALKNAASAQQNKAINGARKEQIEGAYELWQKAIVGETVMKKSYDRMRSLYDQKSFPHRSSTRSRLSTMQPLRPPKPQRASTIWLSMAHA